MRTDQVPPVIQLFDGGYGRYIVPLRPNEKAPRDIGWPLREYPRAEIESAALSGCNFGLKHSGVPAIDCDVTDPEVAAELRKLLRELYPAAPCRIGAAPKFALAFRTSEPFPKSVITLRGVDGRECGKIEFRSGTGHQFVVAGIHPVTGLPYRWEDNGFSGGVEVLAQRHLSTLPPLGASDIEDVIIPRIAQVLSARNISVERIGAGRMAESAPAQDTLLAPDGMTLRDVVALIPNDARFDDRTAWIKMAVAIKASAGDDPDGHGFAVWKDWCGKWLGGTNSPDVIRSTWQSLRPPLRVGFSYLEDLARPHGYSVAQREFEALDPSPHVAEEADASATPPLPTDGERLVALTRCPATVFFVEALSSSDDASLLDRWSALNAARGVRDPLAPVFMAKVLPSAKKIAREHSRDIERFTASVQLDLASASDWQKLNPEDQQLLLRAALVLCADKAELLALNRSSAGPVVEIGRRESSDFLIPDLLPARGFGFLFGNPGAGKSFVGISLAARIAGLRSEDPLSAPVQFLGRDVPHGSVYYFCSEDHDGVAHRAATYAETHGLDLRHLRIFSRVPPLRNFERALTFVLDALTRGTSASCPAPRLFIFDVWSAAVDGMETDTADATAATQAAKCLNRMFGVATIALHHQPRAQTKSEDRMRGSVVYDAEADCLLHVKGVANGIVLRVTKAKHAPGGAQFMFHLKDGVLHEGAGVAVATASNAEADARDVAGHLRALTTESAGVTRREFRRDAKVEFAPRFDDAKRLSRAIERAESEGYIRYERKDKHYYRGSVEPPNELLLPGDIPEVVFA